MAVCLYPVFQAQTTLTTNDIVISKLTQILSYLRQGTRHKKLKKKDKGNVSAATPRDEQLPPDDHSERLCFQVNWMRRGLLKLTSGELATRRWNVAAHATTLTISLSSSVSLMMSAITSCPRARPLNLQKTRTGTESETETARRTARAADTPILRNHEEMNTRSSAFLCVLMVK